MVNAKTACEVLSFLVAVGYATPLDVGVCVLGDENGIRAWRILNSLLAEGYVYKPRHAKYHGTELAALQRELWA